MNPSSNLFLIGPMGAGKSTVGLRLARALGLQFLDLDQLIESAAGATIPLLFEMEGESSFRLRETRALDLASQQPGLVLATGGGSVLSALNREYLSARGFVLYLEAAIEMQLERLSRDRSRPLLRTPDRAQRLRELALTRNPLYRSIADLTIPADRAGPGRTMQRTLTALRDVWAPLPPAAYPPVRT